jgi:hypothetical protein
MYRVTELFGNVSYRQSAQRLDLPAGWPDEFVKKSPKMNVCMPAYFGQHLYKTFSIEKISPHFLGYFCNIKNTQSKQSPNRRKIAQSGHPACQLVRAPQEWFIGFKNDWFSNNYQILVSKNNHWTDRAHERRHARFTKN